MTRNLEGFMNLDYVEIRGVPYVKSKRFGQGTDAEVLKRIENYVAKALITRRRPLTGEEVLFFRHALGLSQKELGAHLGYSDVAILKWEKNRSKRLEPVNEVALRALMAGFFKLKLLGTFEALLGDEKAIGKLTVRYEAVTEEDAA